MNRRQFSVLIPSLALGHAARGNAVTDYPDRAVKIVVPFSPGGTVDALGRLIARGLGDLWKHPVIVDNKPGAGTLLGNDAVAKSGPDGYTILLTISSVVQLPSLQKAMSYDVEKDLAPVAQVALSANLFSVASAIPVSTLQEFVAYAKKNPGKLNYGSYGAGTSSHIQGEIFKAQAGIDLAHIPYKGGAPLMNDMLGGQLATGFLDIGGAKPHLASGKFKVLAITGEKRSKLVPNVPTFGEAGFKDFEPYGFFGVFLPSRTPAPIIDKVSRDIVSVISTPEATAAIEGLGVQAMPLGNEAFAKVVQRDLKIWSRTIRAANITMD